MIRVAFLTGTRAEYDLLAPVLRALADHHPQVRPQVIAAAAHCSPFHGGSLDQIRADGFELAAQIPSQLAADTPLARGLSFAGLTDGLLRALASAPPTWLVVAGDREEALAGALAGNFLGIPVAHLFGGDRCLASDLDEVLRPAISKLAHLHFTATEAHRARLIRMGEQDHRVITVGATGLDRFAQEPPMEAEELSRGLGIDAARPFFLVIHHPSPLLGEERGAAELAEIFAGLAPLECPLVVSQPNADPGSARMRRVIEAARAGGALAVHANLPRGVFVNAYRRCAAIVGNSSSIVIESSFARVTGILVGHRQDLREVGANVLRVPAERAAVRAAAERALSDDAWREAVAECACPYGDGAAGPRVAARLAAPPVDADLLRKTLAY